MKKRLVPRILQTEVLTVILALIPITTACQKGDPLAGETKIVRADPAIDAIIPPTAKIEKLAGGFRKTEGPVWHHDGYLLFSELESCNIYRWMPNGKVTVLQITSELTGKDRSDPFIFRSNGLTLYREGRLIICWHRNRRVMRVEKTGVLTILADRYEGKRLNSPNDLVYRSNGTLYFTDPPFGLPKSFEDPQR